MNAAGMNIVSTLYMPVHVPGTLTCTLYVMYTYMYMYMCAFASNIYQLHSCSYMYVYMGLG